MAIRELGAEVLNSRKTVKPSRGPSAKILSKKTIKAFLGPVFDFGNRKQHTPFVHYFVLRKKIEIGVSDSEILEFLYEF